MLVVFSDSRSGYFSSLIVGDDRSFCKHWTTSVTVSRWVQADLDVVLVSHGDCVMMFFASSSGR